MSIGHKVFKGRYCGVYEIAEYAGVSKAQIAHWLNRDWFPAPLDEPAMGRVWDYKEVTAALAARGYPKEVDENGLRITVKRYSLSDVPAPEE